VGRADPAAARENVFIVAKDGRAIVKATAGADLGPWNGNWKMRCHVIVRRTGRNCSRSTPTTT
jgi:acetone carboxylase gamma subunit